jgi:hypothetical protein
VNEVDQNGHPGAVAGGFGLDGLDLGPVAVHEGSPDTQRWASALTHKARRGGPILNAARVIAPGVNATAKAGDPQTGGIIRTAAGWLAGWMDGWDSCARWLISSTRRAAHYCTGERARLPGRLGGTGTRRFSRGLCRADDDQPGLPPGGRGPMALPGQRQEGRSPGGG